MLEVWLQDHVCVGGELGGGCSRWGCTCACRGGGRLPIMAPTPPPLGLQARPADCSTHRQQPLKPSCWPLRGSGAMREMGGVGRRDPFSAQMGKSRHKVIEFCT